MDLAGVQAFRVEEYKRPKFQVQLDPPKAAAKTQRRGDAPRAGHGIHRRGHR